MRYNIKCDECGKTFLAESQTFGKVKYRCPYCGKILTCKIDSMTGKRVKARLVVPVTERSQTFDKNGKPLPLVPVVVEKSAVVARRRLLCLLRMVLPRLKVNSLTSLRGLSLSVCGEVFFGFCDIQKLVFIGLPTVSAGFGSVMRMLICGYSSVSASFSLSP